MFAPQAEQAIAMPHHLSILLTPLALALLAALASGPAWGQPAESLPQRIQAAAGEALATRYPDDAHRFRVRIRRLDQGLEAADATLRIALPAAQDVPRGLTQTPVYVGGQKTGWALLYVAHYDSVAVPQADLRAGDALTPDQVETAWIETTRFRGEPLRAADLRALSAAGPVYASRTLRAGRALRHGDLRPPYAADTGEAVEMTYQRGALTFRLRCKAREPGFAGEAIRLYAPTTDAVYRARLTEAGRAEWIETL